MAVPTTHLLTCWCRGTWEQFYRGRLEEFESYCEPEQDRVKMQFLVRFSEVIGIGRVLHRQ